MSALPEELTKPQKPVGLGRAAFYAVLYPLIRDIGRKHGYSIAIHGSMVRDMDLVAVPWIKEAVDAKTLVQAIKDELGAVTHTQWGDEHFPDLNPSERPHGRKAYSLHFTDNGGQGAYIDISVMPLCT